MSNVAVKSLDDFLRTLSVDTRNDKIRDFLRFYQSQGRYFTSDDTKEDIERTKEVWAGYAYLVFLDKLNGKPLNLREENFLDAYFNNYLNQTSSIGLENDLKGLYIRHRLSSDFEFNKNAIDPITKWANHPEYENGLAEYSKTIQNILSMIYKKEIKIELEEENIYNTPKSISASIKNNIVILSEKFLSDNYIDMLRADYDIRLTYDMIYNICTHIEHMGLINVKRNEISKTALIYTIEDYLYSKSSKNTGVSKAYRNLYESSIGNRQIIIDARKKALDKIVATTSLNSGSDYNAMSEVINKYLAELLKAQNEMLHYRPDAKYFDTNNLELDAFSKLFTMYVNGLKAMPKTLLTNVTKYFAINGNALTVIDMGMIIKEYDNKISKFNCLDEDSLDEEVQEKLAKRASLIEEKKAVMEIMKFITSNVETYKIEEEILRLITKTDLSEEEKQELYSNITSMCFDNYSDYLELKHRVSHMYDQLDNLAGSNSPSKISLIRVKEKTFSKMMDTFELIDKTIEKKREELKQHFEFEDASRNLVVHKVDDMDKVLSIVQELIGRGIITSEIMIKDSVENGTPLLRNLNPGFKEFAQDALAAKGVKEFKKKKSKK